MSSKTVVIEDLILGLKEWQKEYSNWETNIQQNGDDSLVIDMYPAGYAEKIYFALTGGSVENEREKEMEKVIEQIKDLVATL